MSFRPRPYLRCCVNVESMTGRPGCVRVRVSTKEPLPTAQFWIAVKENYDLEMLRTHVARTLESHYDTVVDPATLNVAIHDFDLCDDVGQILQEGDLITYVFGYYLAYIQCFKFEATKNVGSRT